MKHCDEPCAALGSVCSGARGRLVCSDTFHAMIEEGVMRSRHLWLHACRQAMRSATQRPWYEHNAELSDLTGAATRSGADCAMISTTAGW